MMLAAALALCSCGGVLGFLSPSVAVGRVSAAAAGERTGEQESREVLQYTLTCCCKICFTLISSSLSPHPTARGPSSCTYRLRHMNRCMTATAAAAAAVLPLTPDDAAHESPWALVHRRSLAFVAVTNGTSRLFLCSHEPEAQSCVV